MRKKKVDFRFVLRCDEIEFSLFTDIIENIKRDELAPNLRNLLIFLPYHITREIGKNNEKAKNDWTFAEILSNLSFEEKKLFRAYIELQKRSLPSIEEFLNDSLLKETISQKMDALQVIDKSITIVKQSSEDLSNFKPLNPVLNITDSIVNSVAGSHQSENRFETKKSIEALVEKPQALVTDNPNPIKENSDSLDDEESSGESVPDLFG